MLAFYGDVCFTFFCDSVQMFLGGESCTKNNPSWEDKRRGLREERQHNDGGGLIDEILKEGLLK